jgi:hypothetical protein
MWVYLFAEIEIDHRYAESGGVATLWNDDAPSEFICRKSGGSRSKKHPVDHAGWVQTYFAANEAQNNKPAPTNCIDKNVARQVLGMH